jgi:hypothetical protein
MTPNMRDELISCVVATGDRNGFFPQVLRCFAAQTYRHRELVVVDDGKVPVGPLCQDVDNVKYLRLDRRTATGTKLNLGMEAAAGTILQKVDDDYYYAPPFLAASVARIQAAGAEPVIAGWDCFLIALAGSPKLYFSGHGWMAGGTLSFRRAVWEAAAFRDVPKDEDAHFLKDHGCARAAICAPELYILVRHGRNTWNKFKNGAGVDSYVRSLEAYPKSIADVVAGEESARLYAKLRKGSTGR